MKKIISIINIKGGGGKTSSTVNIASVFALNGYKCLILDVDKQSNATQYLNRYDEQLESMFHVFMGQSKIEDIIRATEIKGLYIAPSTIELIKIRDIHLEGVYDIISKQIQQLDYDYIFIDCPPDLNYIVDNVLVASTEVLVPIKIDNWALLGFGYLMEKIFEIRKKANPSLRFIGAFITMDKARTKVSKEAKKQLKEHLKDDLFKTCIRDNASLVTSTFYQKPVVVFDKNSNSSKDYHTLSNELFKKLQY